MDSGYDREKALIYAEKWALARNPDYIDFHNLGGDCTNFVSQCLYAGCGVMNMRPGYGWYYLDSKRRTASWAGVVYLYTFLVNNKGAGPYGEEVSAEEAQPGDVVQLGFPGERYTHAALIVGREAGEIYVSAHSSDALRRPLSSYLQTERRFIAVLGARANGE